jgi:EAL and modified HD-GYP domain-containing signal transduction protein
MSAAVNGNPVSTKEDLQPLVQVHVGRQPICDRKQQTFAYELLFRDSPLNRMVIGNAEQATADVIVRSFMDIGIERLVGSGKAFINVSRDFILGGYCRSLPNERVVLEILEDAVAESELLSEVNTLRRAGYPIALDDFTFTPAHLPLIPLADIIKVDIRQVDRATIQREAPALRQAVCSLLAEKVETLEEYEFCRQNGFDSFQGYFFCRPQVVSAATVPSNRLSLFRLLGELHKPEVSVRELERVVGEDVALCYRLLRYINSAYFSMPKAIESVGHAVRLVGVEDIRRLASLIMLSSISDKPKELIAVSLIRARMCELLATHCGARNKGASFTVGLFSALDAFLDLPMDQAIELLPICDEIRRALTHHEGSLGEILGVVLRYEQMNLDGSFHQKLGFDVIEHAYWDAVAWQRQLMQAIP